jgi:hypothetical protein
MTYPSVNRRDLLRIGTVALGSLCLPATLRGAASVSARARAKSCILLYMNGGPSHIDLWDLKPQAPEEVRGEFRPIATSVPGMPVCEHLPLTARHMHRLAQVRSVCHQDSPHGAAIYHMLTGNRPAKSSNDLGPERALFPNMGSAFGRLDRAAAKLPKAIEVTDDYFDNQGQHAGFLGAACDPFSVKVTTDGKTAPPGLEPLRDVAPTRLAGRAALLGRLDQKLRHLEARAQTEEFDQLHQQALDLLSRPQIIRAFDLEREPLALRQRYGLHRHGQSNLLARRLVEAGARFVTVYWGTERQDWADGQGLRFVGNPWDTHRNHFALLKNDLLPPADRSFAALIEDLHERGLLNETLLIWMGDFGRTPQVDRKYASRHHWPDANTALMAGAGIPGGAVHGRTDRHAAHITDGPVSPADLAASIFHLLGVDPHATLEDGQGRPYRLSEGEPIKLLLS